MSREPKSVTVAEYRRAQGLPPAGADRAARRPVQTETMLQIAVADWLRLLTWAEPAPVFTHVANERHSKAESIRCWRMGQTSGIPDFVFWLELGQTLQIELKSPTGSLEDSQKKIHAQLAQLGHRTYVCRSLREVHAVLVKHRVLFVEPPLARAMRESEA